MHEGRKTVQMNVDIIVKSQTSHDSNSQVVSGSVFLFSLAWLIWNHHRILQLSLSVVQPSLSHTTKTDFTKTRFQFSLLHPHLWFGSGMIGPCLGNATTDTLEHVK